MKKDEILASLRALEEGTTSLRDTVSDLKGTVVFSEAVKSEGQRLSRLWFEGLDAVLTGFGIDEATVEKYRPLFAKLLNLSLKSSWRATYVRVLTETLRDYKDDLVAPVMRFAGEPKFSKDLDKILQDATEEESEYLVEALGCAERGYLRASVVLGWSAAVDRMHRVVEKLGFAEFNKKSAEMKGKKGGRYGKFNKAFNVGSLTELRATVFDNDLLWVLEYWGLIDANQHERLQLCFTMRNNSSHPGEAPITPENLASFYSDIRQIVFRNKKFQL